MSDYLFVGKKEANNNIGFCNVFYLEESVIDDETNINFKLEEYSSFCEGKPITNIKALNSGSFGQVYSVKIDGLEYAIKTQDIYKQFNLEQSEFEVKLAKDLSDVRREDGQRICVSIFECFFLCNKTKKLAPESKKGCEGAMIYIMELGEGSVHDLYMKTDEYCSDFKAKTLLIRSVINRMLENIEILVEKKNTICWDIKPGNTIYNFKTINGKNDINPIFIDLDERFTTKSLNELVNKKKLNYLLKNYKYKGEKIINRDLTDRQIKKIFTTILQFSYIFTSIRRISNLQRGDYIICGAFFLEKQAYEKISALEVIELLVKPTRDNIWLSAAIQMILRSKHVDSINPKTKTDSFRKQFYHYNLYGFPGDVAEKFVTVLFQLAQFYTESLTMLQEPVNPEIFRLSILSLDGFNDEYNQRYLPSIGSNEFVNLDLEDIPDPTTAESSVLRSRKSTKKKKK